jgi:hypothetical protein
LQQAVTPHYKARMFKTIQRLFFKNEGKQPKEEVLAASNHERSIEEYFRDEVERTPFFKQEFKQLVLDHLLQKNSLTKTGNNLTVEEKRELGINTRLSITKELAQSLSSEGLNLENPKLALEEIYYRVMTTKARIDNFARAIKIGIKKFKLLASGDGSECEWCRSNSDHEFGLDILDQIEMQCRCRPYSKCVINPVVEFQ